MPQTLEGFGNVKSVKKNLSATTNGKCFTFEEMSTLLAQIEAVLNSRPLMPISSDDTDLSVLTPGHFLIGQPITALPDRDYSNMRILRRWNLVQKTIQDFWRRWSNEYLTSLNYHQKWRKPHRNVQIGDLVLIKNENIFRCQWPLARVIKVFPGENGRVRVADVKTQRGIYSHPTNKLVVLLTQEEAISQDAPSGSSPSLQVLRFNLQRCHLIGHRRISPRSVVELTITHAYIYISITIPCCHCFIYSTRFHDLFVIITYPLVTILVISFSYLEGKGP